MSMLRVLAVVALLVPGSARAQRWREIGKTSTGNTVYVDPASIVKQDSLVSATVRTLYATPSESPKGPLNASRAIATFNCLRRTVMVKEIWIYHDIQKGTVYEHRKPKIPGYSTTFQSNFSGPALAYLCAPPPPPPAR